MTSPTSQQEKEESHTVLWVIVTLFVIASIASMWAVDYFFSPEMINPNTLTEAVGK